MQSEVKYSQNDEQYVIVDFFADRIGTFLDIGAFDGKTFSNTRRLLELGWAGVLVEPCPSIIGSLRGNVREFGSRAIVLECAITPCPGRVQFFDDGGGAVATTSRDHVRKWSNVSFSECDVLAMTPELLLDLVNEKFDFVKIDIEGTNLEIIRLMPWHRLPGCRLVCLEHDNSDAKILDVLDPFGFAPIHRNGENLILAR